MRSDGTYQRRNGRRSRTRLTLEQEYDYDKGTEKELDPSETRVGVKQHNQGEEIMGLLDDVTKKMGGLEGMASMAAKNPQLIAAAATLLSSKDSSIGGAAGLSGLMSAFDSKGLGNVMSSWVGSGKNESIGADQLASVLGNDTISQFASKAGIGLAEAGPALAAVLPSLVNQLTPKGEVPQSSSLEGALSGLLSSMG